MNIGTAKSVRELVQYNSQKRKKKNEMELKSIPATLQALSQVQGNKN